MKQISGSPGFSNGYRLPIAVAIGVWLIYFAFLPPGIYSIDGNSMLAVSESLVAHHAITVPPDLGSPGRNGQIFSNWYPLLSFLALPFVYLASILSRVAHLPFHYLAAILAVCLSGAFTAATAGAVVLLALRLGSSRRGAWLAALSFAFGSLALVYFRTFYAEPLLAFLTASALYLAIGRSRAEIIYAGGLAALAILAKPTGIIIGPILSAYLLTRRERFRISVLPVCGTLLGFALYASYNIWRFGNPLTFGQPWAFSLWSIPKGLLGLLLSPGFGLLWYCPVVLLAAAGFRLASRQHVLEAGIIIATFLAFLSLHSYWTSWSGGWSWGPRFLLPGLPGLCALTGLLTAKLRRLLVFLSLLGFLVNSPTLFSYYERWYAELNEQGIPMTSDQAWSLHYAPFLHAWPAAIRTFRDASSEDVRNLFSERGTPSPTIAKSRALRIVAVWWWVLPIAGISRWLGFSVAVLFVAFGCFILARAAPVDSA